MIFPLSESKNSNPIFAFVTALLNASVSFLLGKQIYALSAPNL